MIDQTMQWLEQIAQVGQLIFVILVLRWIFKMSFYEARLKILEDYFYNAIARDRENLQREFTEYLKQFYNAITKEKEMLQEFTEFLKQRANKEGKDD